MSWPPFVKGCLLINQNNLLKQINHTKTKLYVQTTVLQVAIIEFMEVFSTENNKKIIKLPLHEGSVINNRVFIIWCDKIVEILYNINTKYTKNFAYRLDTNSSIRIPRANSLANSKWPISLLHTGTDGLSQIRLTSE